MKAPNGQSIVGKAKHNAGVERRLSLIDRVGYRWLPRLHAHLVSGFSSMEDILKWLSEHGYYDVYSFDVFDTLLRRRIEPPEEIARLVVEYVSGLLAQSEVYVSPEEVLTQRNRVGKVLRLEAVSRGEDPDCHLEHLTAETLRVLEVDNVLNCEEIVNYEVGLEKKATELMPGARAVLTYLQSLGRRIICISDSYLSPNQMGTILEHHDLLKYIDKLYVSSDVGRRKSTGKLFQHVIENEGSKLVHIGDNRLVDIITPMQLGVDAVWFHSRSEARRKSELRRLYSGRNKMDYVNAVIGNPQAGDNSLYRIGYQILGPALTVFVHNVAEQARKDGVEVLFFIARDGYALKKIYEILLSSVCTDRSLPTGRYMCLSRFPVRAASLHELVHEDVSEVYWFREKFRKKDATFRDVLTSYGLEPSHFLGIANRHEVDITTPLDDASQDTKLRQLLESNGFREVIRAESDGARSLLREYLVSIGFIGKRKVGVVDAQSEGLTQTLLQQIFLDDKDYPTVSGYYFNMLNLHKTRIDLDLSHIRGLVYDWRNSPLSEQRQFLFFGTLIELFTHPNHGITVGYKRVNGRIMPIFRKTPQESRYHLTSHALQGILSYARDYSTYYGLHNNKCDELLEHVKSNIKRWLEFPPKRHVEALKHLYVTVDWPQEKEHDLITQIKASDIITVRGFFKKLVSSSWPQGTLALTPLPGLNWMFNKIAPVGNQSRKLAGHFTVRWPRFAARTQRITRRLK